MIKKDIDPANLPIRPMKEDEVDAVGVAESRYFGVARPEYYWVKSGPATKGTGNSISLVAEARMSILQAECKR